MSGEELFENLQRERELVKIYLEGDDHFIASDAGKSLINSLRSLLTWERSICAYPSLLNDSRQMSELSLLLLERIENYTPWILLEEYVVELEFNLLRLEVALKRLLITKEVDDLTWFEHKVPLDFLASHIGVPEYHISYILYGKKKVPSDLEISVFSIQQIAQFYGYSNIASIDSEIVIELDPGNASNELIAELLADISLLYRFKEGGSGINFQLSNILQLKTKVGV